ncbi:MAG: LysR family transcriptional regulator [Pseudomonadota bacterium]
MSSNLTASTTLRLDPRSLRLFVSVVERGSIAAAAQQGHIAPAAVSKRMSELEAQLRTPLLARTYKGAQATPAGLALLNLARRVLVDLDDIALQMRDWSGGTRGQVLPRRHRLAKKRGLAFAQALVRHAAGGGAPAGRQPAFALNGLAIAIRDGSLARR